MFYDWTYILVLAGALLCMIASAGVKSTYKKYSRVPAACGMTGAEVAERLLSINNISDVSVNHILGSLTDHYNPKTGEVNLSDDVYDSRSVAAIGVAAHECGHVMQHNNGYVPLAIRSALVPIANFGSNLGLPMVIIGLILGIGYTRSGQDSIGMIIAEIGIVLFCFGVLFQLITLPVEFNASHRALKMLEKNEILEREEISGSRAVLGAAAMTYVAAAASSILQLLRLLLIVNNNRRRD